MGDLLRHVVQNFLEFDPNKGGGAVFQGALIELKVTFLKQYRSAFKDVDIEGEWKIFFKAAIEQTREQICFQRFGYLLEYKLMIMESASVETLKRFTEEIFEYSKIMNIQLQNTMRPEIHTVLSAFNVEIAEIEGFEVLGLNTQDLKATQGNSEAKMYLEAIQGKWDNLREQIKACQFSKEEEAKVFKMPAIPVAMPYMKVQTLLEHFEARKKAKVQNESDAIEDSQGMASVSLSLSLDV